MLLKRIFLAIFALCVGTTGAITIDSIVINGQANGQITKALTGSEGAAVAVNIPLHSGVNLLNLTTQGTYAPGSWTRKEVEFTIDGINYALVRQVGGMGGRILEIEQENGTVHTGIYVHQSSQMYGTNTYQIGYNAGSKTFRISELTQEELTARTIAPAQAKRAMLLVPYTTSLSPNSDDIAVLFYTTAHGTPFGFVQVEFPESVSHDELYRRALAKFRADTFNKIGIVPNAHAAVVTVNTPTGNIPAFIAGASFVRGQVLYDISRQQHRADDYAWIRLDELIRGLTAQVIAQGSSRQKVTIATSTPNHSQFDISLETAKALVEGGLLDQLKEARNDVRRRTTEGFSTIIYAEGSGCWLSDESYNQVIGDAISQHKEPECPTNRQPLGNRRVVINIDALLMEKHPHGYDMDMIPTNDPISLDAFIVNEAEIQRIAQRLLHRNLNSEELARISEGGANKYSLEQFVELLKPILQPRHD